MVSIVQRPFNYSSFFRVAQKISFIAEDSRKREAVRWRSPYPAHFVVTSIENIYSYAQLFVQTLALLKSVSVYIERFYLCVSDH